MSETVVGWADSDMEFIHEFTMEASWPPKLIVKKLGLLRVDRKATPRDIYISSEGERWYRVGPERYIYFEIIRLARQVDDLLCYRTCRCALKPDPVCLSVERRRNG